MTTTAEKYRSIIDELSVELYERRDHLEMIAIGDLAGENTFLLGEPGTAKSMLVRKTCERIVGANYWETLLDRQLPMETIFGPIDIKEFETTGNWHRRTDGYLPWAHKVFLDEVGKAGPAVLNPLLTVLNEGIFHNNSKPMQCNIISAVGASNEELEPELAAMWDRWLIRMVVEPIKEPGNFAALLSSTTVAPPKAATTIALPELEQARTEVPSVKLPPGIVDTIIELRNELRAEQVRPSDRRWKKAMRLLQAAAYLQSRDTVDDDDLAILRHVLWDVVEQIPVVEKAVLSRTSPLTNKALEYAAMIQEIEAQIDARRGQAVETRAAYGGEAQHKVSEITKGLNSLIEQANRQGRSTARLDDVRDQLKAIKVRIFAECLNVPADRAAAMAN